MAKLEKVIKALECCTTMGKDGFPMCAGCPYDTDGTCPELDTMHRDVLELLRAKEPVKPDWMGDVTHWYACGKCRHPIDRGDNFCRHCGRPVKWDE